MKRLLTFLLGLALGVGLAILIGWVWFPLDRRDASPATMRADYRAEYIRLVALTYAAEGDLTRAEARLAALDPDTPTAPLVALTEQWIRDGKPAPRIAPLARLAHDLGADTPPMAPYLEGDRP